MGRISRKKVKSVGSIPKKSMNLKKKRRSKASNKAVSNNNSIEVVPTESVDDTCKPSTSLNSTIEVIEIDDSLLTTDKLEDTKTASSRFTAFNNYDIIDITDTTIEDDKYERCQIETSKVTVINIKDDDIIDITDTTVVDNELKNSQPTSSKETGSCHDDVQIISHTTYAQNNIIDLITISDDSDEENIPHQSKICIHEQKTVKKSIKQRLGFPSHSTNLSKKKYISPLRNCKQKLKNGCLSSYDYLSHDLGAFVIDKRSIPQHLQDLNKYKPKNGPYQKRPNPSTKTVTEHHRNLRPIIIDGLNIGHAHGCGIFSARGISLCIQFFANRGHKEIIAFIPQHRQGPPGSESNELLNDLVKRGHICYTPSRKVQNERMTCYDDRIILNYAHKCDGVVVSNDNYRDLYGESEEFREIIENRQVMVTFVRDEIIVPDDQYNRISEVRSLSDILCFPE